MNIVVAFLLLFIVALYQGESDVSTTLEKVEPGTPAAAAGMQAGDRVISIGGKEMSSWDEVRTEILTHPGRRGHHRGRARRPGSGVELLNFRSSPTAPATWECSPESPTAISVSSGPFAPRRRRRRSMVKLIFVGLKMMFSGQAPVTGSQGLAGPVGIIQLSSEAFQGGYYLTLLALISINLAILNMLPVLPLDGGHVLFSVIERIRGKSVSLRVFEQVSMIGLIIFVALFILATSNDIGRLFKG